MLPGWNKLQLSAYSSMRSVLDTLGMLIGAEIAGLELAGLEFTEQRIIVGLEMLGSVQ